MYNLHRQGDRVGKKLWVINENDDYFLVYEEEESCKVGDNYDDQGVVVSVIPLPGDAIEEGWNPDAFEGLMLLDDVNSLLLLLMDFAYRAGRRDQQAAILGSEE